jgi:hypothetical protein
MEAQLPLLVLLAAVTLLLWAAWGRRRKAASGATPPSPPGTHWLWGNVLQLGEYVKRGEHMDKFIWDVLPHTGPIFQLRFGPLIMVVVLDPDAVREVGGALRAGGVGGGRGRGGAARGGRRARLFASAVTMQTAPPAPGRRH